jgi:hypothetical protein
MTVPVVGGGAAIEQPADQAGTDTFKPIAVARAHDGSRLR